jgi:UDP-N-acetyl-D-galactosamine dehydrogenase
MNRTVSIIGLGYVGLPVAVAFGMKSHTIGFDVNPERIRELQDGIDRTGEVKSEDMVRADILFTDRIEDLRLADFHIVAVPTPVDEAHQPDLSLLLKASDTVGKALKRGDIVVYESTVYPGVTEDECVPVLEKASGLSCGSDFTVGYSPERINPGDREHSFTKINKVVSGQDPTTLETVAQVYESVVTAGVHRASSIKVAEAAKVIENTQRDLNIALMNELALIFERLGIDTGDVLAAAGTKWNFLAGRRINDGMGRFIAQRTIREMIHAGNNILGSTVTVLGLTFKEDCPDIRNSKVIDIIRELEDYGVKVQVHDPLADPKEVNHEYRLDLVPLDELRPASAVILAVAHRHFRDMPVSSYRELLCGSVLIDVKGVFHRDELEGMGIRLWRL